jgi:hypothetical protein
MDARELWKASPLKDGYLVSTHGQVQNGMTGTMLKRRINPSGYPYIYLGRGKFITVHRLMAFTFFGAPKEGQTEVAHNDGVRTNNHISNLRWCTKTENQKDREIHGTTNRGERCGMAKFTNEQVRELRERMASRKESNCALGREYGVSNQTIRAIRLHHSYTEA